jgi:hypothetical protein
VELKSPQPLPVRPNGRGRKARAFLKADKKILRTCSFSEIFGTNFACSERVLTSSLVGTILRDWRVGNEIARTVVQFSFGLAPIGRNRLLPFAAGCVSFCPLPVALFPKSSRFIETWPSL